MNKECKTCGGECAVIRDTEDEVVLRCTCCGNEYSYPKQKAAPVPATPVSQKKDGGEAVFDACIDSVIELTCTAGGNCYAGSGFAVGNRGYAVTNTHVVTENGRPIHDIQAYVCGKTVPAEIVVLGDDRGGSGSGEDLALIRLKNPPSRMKGVTFAEGELRNGQKLYVIGNALGMGTCITSGIISDKRRTVNGKPRFMTDGAANHGNSGGPVFDEAGEVIGAIVAGIDNAKGMNFAIPADIILDFLEKCKSIAKDLRV